MNRFLSSGKCEEERSAETDCPYLREPPPRLDPYCDGGAFRELTDVSQELPTAGAHDWPQLPGRLEAIHICHGYFLTLASTGASWSDPSWGG
jgi:hypothetical protein